AGAGTRITLAFSPAAGLPPEIRPLARELAARCERIARAADGIELREVAPDARDAPPGVRRLERTDDLGDVRATRSFSASVVVERAAAGATVRRVLEFPDAASFEQADFRLALALRDVTTGER